MPKEQKFEIGYHLNTWDFEGRPEEGFPFLAEVGFVWYEALIFNSLGDDFARRYMTLESLGLPPAKSDTDLLRPAASLQQGAGGLWAAALVALRQLRIHRPRTMGIRARLHHDDYALPA